MLLVLSATASVAWYRFNQVQSVSIDIKALGNEASARLLVGGLPALQDWIDEAEHRYRDRRIFIVDQSGDDLRKRKLPTTYRNYIERLRDAGFLGKELIPSRRDDPLLLTPLFTAWNEESELNGFVRRPSHGHDALLLINQIMPLTLIVTVALLLPTVFVSV